MINLIIVPDCHHSEVSELEIEEYWWRNVGQVRGAGLQLRCSGVFFFGRDSVKSVYHHNSVMRCVRYMLRYILRFMLRCISGL